MHTDIDMTDPKLGRLFTHLHRGGSWAYYWTAPDKKTDWHPVGRNGTLPKGANIYFGVHPTRAKRASNQRARAIDICAVNCLFAEFDAKDFGDSKAATLEHIHGLALPPSVIVDSGGGYHCYWLLDEPYSIADDAERERIDRIQKAWVAFVGSDDGAKDLARVLRVPGTTNGKYTPPRSVTFHSANFEDLYDLEDLEAISFVPPTLTPADTRNHTRADDAGTHSAYARAAVSGELARVRSARPSTRNTTLNKAAYAIGTLVGAGALNQADVEYELLNAALATGLPEQEALRTIRSGLTAGIARPREIPEKRPAGTYVTPSSETHESQDFSEMLRKARLTDVGNAECMVAIHGDKLRFCHTREKWFFWNGERWLQDETGQAWRIMLETVRARQAQISKIEDEDFKKRFSSFVVNSENERRLQSALSSASKLATMATKIDQYDRDPMLANAGTVTIDLQNCNMRENRQADYITRRLGADYVPEATCPRWLRFLNEVFNGDQNLIAYIQRAIGYTLTGDTREQKLFLCYGAGANGKSVFLTTIGNLLGEYATSRAFATFDADEHNRVNDDLAGLKGARFVSVIETNEDRRINEARVKSITGQDQISCRFLFGEYFSFRPQFKLWLAMNHKPAIHGVDRGIWRRIQLIPFTQTFEGREDKTLENKLQVELSGILNWALHGLHEWHTQGLNPPRIITEATDQYRAENDIVGQWLDDCTVIGAQMEMKSGDGYKSFKEWCINNGMQRPIAQIHWSRRLVERGITPGPRTGKGVFYKGVGLVTSSEECESRT